MNYLLTDRLDQTDVFFPHRNVLGSEEGVGYEERLDGLFLVGTTDMAEKREASISIVCS